MRTKPSWLLMLTHEATELLRRAAGLCVCKFVDRSVLFPFLPSLCSLSAFFFLSSKFANRRVGIENQGSTRNEMALARQIVRTSWKRLLPVALVYVSWA